MFAVIKTGGKQYRVAEGDLIKVEKLPNEVGSKVDLGAVLAVGEGADMKVGNPTVEGASVVAEVVEHGKRKKIVVFKKKRRKGYEKTQGHRQQYTAIRISAIKP
ncbi:MAG: 50S ribosomal protein L21 [Thermodesulfobacteriota bacterium]